MRKKDAELKQTLLQCAGKIECEEGVDAINMRRLASEANVAVGTVYNYFESKQEVLLALTEAYWEDALKQMRQSVTAERFSEQIAQIVSFLREKMNDCAQILMQSLRSDPESGKIRMAEMQNVLLCALIERLDKDSSIREDVWNEQFTKEAFAEFTLANLTQLMQQRGADEKILLEIIKRVLY